MLKPRPEELRIKTQKKKVKDVEEEDLEVDMEKITVLPQSRQSPVQECDQGQERDNDDQEEEIEEDVASEEEELQPRPVRVRRKPQRYDPSQAGQ